jgi:Glycosyl transferases group 1
VTDVLIVSLGSTGGWRAADAELAASLERAGASVAVVTAAKQRDVRTFALTDLQWARAARAAARHGIAEHAPRAIVYSTTTAALLWPRPGAIRYDTLARDSRPGRHGVWQRPVECRRLAQAPLLVPMTPGQPGVAVRIPVEPSGPAAMQRDLAAVAYAPDPVKRRLDLLLAAWGAARRAGEELVVTGAEGPPRDGVRFAGRVAPDEFRGLLRRARVFVAAPAREDYGIAPLEAVADGCVLVTTPAAGPYPALAITRAIDPRLVTDDLAAGIRAALDDPRPDYAARAADALAPFRRAAVDQVVREELLPRLLG